MKKFVLAMVLLLLLPTVVFSAPLTLDQCVARGLSFNPEIKAYLLAVKEADAGVFEAWGAFFPTLTLSYGVTQLSNNAGAERDTDYLDQQSQSYNARLSQPLFTGLSGVAGLKKARQSKEYQEFLVQYMRLQLVREIRTSFYDILLAQQLVSKWTESVQRLENQRLIADAWVQQELATRLRLLEVDVERSNAKQQLISAESSLAIGQARLKEWLALETTEDLEIEGSLLQAESDPKHAIESGLESALRQRPELQMARLDIEMARQDAKTILARNLPRVDIDASYTDYNREYDSSILSDDERDYYSVALNLSMRPFQGGRNIFALRRQRLAVERLQEQQTKQRNAIVTEVKTRFHQLQEGFGRLATANKSLDESREAYEFVSRSAELGISSLDDLLDAELRLTRAEINRINSYHALQQARVQLDYAVGNR